MPDETDGDNLDALYMLVELRRKAFRFIDISGSIADELLSAYDHVAFEATPEPVSLPRLSVSLRNDRVTLAVDANQVIYESHDPIDIIPAASEALVFFRKVERHLSPGRYERVGVRFIFQVSTGLPLAELTDVMFGIRPKDGWKPQTLSLRYSSSIGPWGVTVGVQPRTLQEDGTREFRGDVAFDIDQFKTNVPAEEALHLDLPGLLRQARSVAEEFAGKGVQ